jgi:hypothetical protein
MSSSHVNAKVSKIRAESPPKPPPSSPLRSTTQANDEHKTSSLDRQRLLSTDQVPNLDPGPLSEFELNAKMSGGYIFNQLRKQGLMAVSTHPVPAVPTASPNIIADCLS